MKNKVITAICAVFFVLAAAAGFFLLPDELGVGIIIFIAKHKTVIGYAILALLAGIIGYSLYKTKQPKILKKKLLALLSAPFVAYAVICLYVFLFPTDYGRCDYYTHELNGGVKEFNGQKYTINLCGTGGDDMQSDDEVRLQVFDDKGELVALRHFTVNWNDSGFPKVLEYHPDYITYYDNTGSDFDKRLSMPPTATDWIRARLPLVN